MVNPNIKFTVRDYMNLPESEEKRYELIAGELYMVPSPNPFHQKITGNLFRILSDFVEEHDLGLVFIAPLDVVLSDEDVLQPDVIFISKEREGIIGEQNIQGAPDLVIEVLSPSTAGRDRTIKRARYLRYGVREYWIVDPQTRSIEVMKAGQTEFETQRVYPEGTAATSPLLADLRMDVIRIFV